MSDFFNQNQYLINFINNNKSLFEAIESVSKTLNAFNIEQLEQINQITQNLNPIIEATKNLGSFSNETQMQVQEMAVSTNNILNYYKPIQDAINNFPKPITIPQSLIRDISGWSSTMQKISTSVILENIIPEEIYAPLNELINLEGNIDSFTDMSGNPDVPTNEHPIKKSLTWNELLNLLIAIISLILALISSNQQSQQNTEIISELKQRTLIQEQQLEITKDQLKNEQDQEKRLEEKLNSLMEIVKQSIPNESPEAKSQKR